MAICSIIQRGQLDFINRFDAELYNPKLKVSYTNLEDSKLPLLQLGNCCIINSGTTPSDRDDNLKNGPTLFKTTDIRNKVLSPYDEFYHISDAIHQRMAKTQIKAKDVLLNIVGATLDVIGRTAFVPDNFGEANITQAMVLLRVITNKISPEYLFAYLQTKYAQDQIKRYARPTGQYNLNYIETARIVIPQFDEKKQQEIANLIKQSTNARLESDCLYHEAEGLLNKELQLDSFKPVHTTSFSTSYKEVNSSSRFDPTHYRPEYMQLVDFLKKRFVCKTINELVFINRRGLQPEYTKGNIKVVNSQHIAIPHIKYEELETASSSEYSKKFAAHIEKNDILIYSTGAYVGLTSVYLSDDLAIASNHVNILRLKNNRHLAPYYSLVLNSTVGKLLTSKYQRGSAQAELYPNEIGCFLLPQIEDVKMVEISEKIVQSLTLKRKATQLLTQATSRIEELIEQEVAKHKN